MVWVLPFRPRIRQRRKAGLNMSSWGATRPGTQAVKQTENFLASNQEARQTARQKNSQALNQAARLSVERVNG